MDISLAIKQWINTGRKRKEALLLIASIDPILHKKICQYPSRYSDGFIGEYLFNKLPVTTPIVAKKTLPITKHVVPKKLTSEIIDEDLLNVVNAEAKKIYKQMSNYRAQLFSLCSLKQQAFENEGSEVEKRAILARKVMELSYKIDEKYAELNYVKKHNKRPQPILHEIPKSELYRLITNLRKNISKLKNKKELLTKRQTESLNTKIVELNKLLTQYDKLRNT